MSGDGIAAEAREFIELMEDRRDPFGTVEVDAAPVIALIAGLADRVEAAEKEAHTSSSHHWKREYAQMAQRCDELETALRGLIRWVMKVPILPPPRDEHMEAWWNDGTARHNAWAALSSPPPTERDQ